jgi:hypothetical protein
VVEELRDVADRRRRDPLDRAQEQVPVLAPLEALAETAEGPDQLGPVDGEMRGVVLPVVEVGVPVRLEIGVEPAVLHIDLVLVRIDELRVRMPVDLGRDLVERQVGESTSSWSKRATNSPVARPRAVLVASQMWPFAGGRPP